jgi:hypothetical protein
MYHRHLLPLLLTALPALACTFNPQRRLLISMSFPWTD